MPISVSHERVARAGSHAAHSGLGTPYLIVLLSATLISRLLLLSSPYYGDGPAFVEMVAHGQYIAENPPSYFFFLFSALLLTKTGLSAASAITLLNVSFGVGGVFAFAKLCECIFPVFLSRLLGACYAVMNVVWFAAVIHSPNASSTCFAPALVWCMLRQGKTWFSLGCVAWAFATGFRPSDGVFLLPLLLLCSVNRTWAERIRGMAAAGAVTLAWWIPTAVFYHSFFGPIAKSMATANALSDRVSLLRSGITPQTLASEVRFVAAFILALNILLPLALMQLARVGKDRLTLLALTWVLPGSLFLGLIYMAGPIYICFMAGGLLLLAGLYCRRLRPGPATAWLTAYLLVSTCFMLGARPISAPDFPRRVLNAYILEFDAWSIKHQYAKDLAEMERDAAANHR